MQNGTQNPTVTLPPGDLLFLSDIHQELDVAQDAGWNILQLLRGETDAESHHRQVAGFDQINLDLFPYECIDHFYR